MIDDRAWPPTPGLWRALRKLNSGYDSDPRKCRHGRLLALCCRKCELEYSEATR